MLEAAACLWIRPTDFDREGAVVAVVYGDKQCCDEGQEVDKCDASSDNGLVHQGDSDADKHREEA